MDLGGEGGGERLGFGTLRGVGESDGAAATARGRGARGTGGSCNEVDILVLRLLCTLVLGLYFYYGPGA